MQHVSLVPFIFCLGQRRPSRFYFVARREPRAHTVRFFLKSFVGAAPRILTCTIASFRANVSSEERAVTPVCRCNRYVTSPSEELRGNCEWSHDKIINPSCFRQSLALSSINSRKRARILAMRTRRKTSKRLPLSAFVAKKRRNNLRLDAANFLREEYRTRGVHKQHSGVARRDALMTGILNNDNDAVNGSPFCPLNRPRWRRRCPREEGGGEGEEGERRRHSMAPVNRALFPRRNFTDLIDRGGRTREMIDFLLRCAPVISSYLFTAFVS